MMKHSGFVGLKMGFFIAALILSGGLLFSGVTGFYYVYENNKTRAFYERQMDKLRDDRKVQIDRLNDRVKLLTTHLTFLSTEVKGRLDEWVEIEKKKPPQTDQRIRKKATVKSKAGLKHRLPQKPTPKPVCIAGFDVYGDKCE